MEETKVNSFLETERIGRLMRVHNLPACRCALQHCRSDFHCKRRLSRLFWQCGKLDRISADGHRPCNSNNDRRRLRRIRQHSSRCKGLSKSAQEHWKFGSSDRRFKHCSNGNLLDFCRPNYNRFRRHGQRRSLQAVKGIFLLDFARRSVLYVRSST